MRKIALIGKSGAGKDYLAAHMINDMGFKRYAFADKLKELCSDIFSWMKVDYQPIEKEQPLNITLNDGTKITKTPREVWTMIGCIYSIDSGYFVRKLKESISYETDVIITDCRTLEELNFCNENEFITIYVNPSKDIYTDNKFDNQVDTLSKKCHFTFNNNFNGVNEFDEFIKKIGEK